MAAILYACACVSVKIVWRYFSKGYAISRRDFARLPS